MAPQQPAPWWAEHGEAIAAYLGLAWAAIAALIAGARRLLRWRELVAARDEGLRVALDTLREAHRNDRVVEILGEACAARRRTLIDEARDRLWLAHGRKRSEPGPDPYEETLDQQEGR